MVDKTRKIIASVSYGHQITAGCLYMEVPEGTTDKEIEELIREEWAKKPIYKISFRDNPEEEDDICW